MRWPSIRRDRVVFLTYLRFDVGAVLADLRMAADARGGAVSPAFVVQVFAENFPAFLILAGLAAITQIIGVPRPAAAGPDGFLPCVHWR